MIEMLKDISKFDLIFLEMIEEEDKVFPEINILDWQK